MGVANGVDKVPDTELADLSNHVSEQCIGGDVEGDAKEEVGTALVELAAEFFAIAEELKEQVAGR